jgi:hypothetical protein
MMKSQESVLLDSDNTFMPNSIEGLDMLSQLEGQIGDSGTQMMGDNEDEVDLGSHSTDPVQKWAQKLRSGGAAISDSISSGRLPEISLSQIAPKVELHKLRGPSMFFGVGQYVTDDDTTRAFTIPAFGELYARVCGNLSFFSSNYMAVAVLIAVCFSLTNVLFIMAMLLLAVMWNWTLTANAEAATGREGGHVDTLPSTQQDTIGGESGSGSVSSSGGEQAGAVRMRMMGAYGVSALVLYYFASSLLWQILLYSTLFTFAHAVFRNNYQYDAEEGRLRDGLAPVPATDDSANLGLGGGTLQQHAARMQMVAQAGAAFGALASVAKSLGVVVTTTAAPVAVPQQSEDETNVQTEDSPRLVVAV